MKLKKNYLKIEKELDKIILAEISTRLNQNRKKLSLSTVEKLLEKINREIVEAHQKGKIMPNLPGFFGAYLQTKAGGKLYLNEKDLNSTEFEAYMEKKDRLEVLFSSSLNALREPSLKQIINEKNRQFDDMYQKTRAAVSLTQKAENIKKTVENTTSIIPRDEDQVISYLAEIVPLKTQLQEIRLGHIQLGNENCFPDALDQLQTAIHLASKSIASKSRRASKFLFNQASTVFHIYKSTTPHISNANALMGQKEELTRYYNLFDGIGDENRKAQVSHFISTIEITLSNLQKEIEKQKAYETVISEKNSRKINQAYEQFLNIKEIYDQGKLDTKRRQKKAISKLEKCCNILKSNGQRIKAREIERFLNSTRIGKVPESAEDLQTQNLFYKKAFLALLPVTIGLALITAYYVVSVGLP